MLQSVGNHLLQFLLVERRIKHARCIHRLHILHVGRTLGNGVVLACLQVVLQLVYVVGNKRYHLALHLQVQEGIAQGEVEQLTFPYLLACQLLPILAWLFVGDASIHIRRIHLVIAFVHDNLSVLHLWQRTDMLQAATCHIDKHLKLLPLLLQRILRLQHGILEAHLLSTCDAGGFQQHNLVDTVRRTLQQEG